MADRDYKKLATGAISQFHSACADILDPLISDIEVIKSYKNLKNILKNIDKVLSSTYSDPKEISRKKEELNKYTLKDIISLVEEHIIRQLYSLAGIQYLIMERTGNYGILGDQRVSISFCRLLNDISPDREVTQFDVDSFRRKILKDRKDINALPLDELKTKVDNFRLKIFKQSFSLHDMTKINSLLKIITSHKKIYVSTQNQELFFLFGDVKTKKKSKYHIYIFETEAMRSPYAALSIVAGNSKNNVNIRRISCETIFYNKWVRIFDYSENEKKRLLEDIDNNIGETIKKIALQKYKVNSKEELLKIKKLFIDEIVEGVLWHEIGHTVVYDNILNFKHIALGKTFHSLGDSLTTVYGEFLADWAPVYNSIYGPLHFFLELSKKPDTREKAERMLYVYLSDNWFLSHEDKEGILPSQTDILVPVLMRYFTSTGIDFDRFTKQYQKDFEYLLKMYTTALESIIAPIQEATFTFRGKNYGFVDIDNFIREILDHPDCKKSWEQDGEQGFQVFYWANIIDWTKNYAPTAFSRVKKLLTEALDNFKKQLLETITSPEVAAEYNNEIRSFLVSRMKELGFYSKVEPISNEEAIKMAMDDAFVFSSEKEKVWSWFKDIIEGNPVEISINYTGSSTPAVTVLQEMLLRGRVGKINDPQVIKLEKTKFDIKSLQAQEKVIELKLEEDVAVPLSEKEKEKEQTLKNHLQKIKSYFDNNKILRIKNLKLNLMHGTERQVKHLARETLLTEDNKSLSDKIFSYESAIMPSDVVFELYTSIERGVCDWNTIHAIARINKQLQLDTPENSPIINKEVIEKIIKGYLNSY